MGVAVRALGIRRVGVALLARSRAMTGEAAVTVSGKARCVTVAVRMGRGWACMGRVSMMANT
jgi:hypothetical protein